MLISTLKKFTRVTIKKGASKNSTLSISKKDLEYWDDKQNAYVIYPGEYEILIGSSSADIRLSTTITVE